MVIVDYRGRFGNNIFQYCLGRIIAERLGYRLKVAPIPGFPNTKAIIDGKDNTGCPKQVLKGQKIDLESVLQDNTPRMIVLEGEFQRYEYYKPYKELIKNNWLKPSIPTQEDIGPEDIVLCIRRSDLVPAEVVPASFFDDAMDRASYKRVFICSESPDDPFVKRFKKRYRATVRPVGTLDNFGFIMLFKKIVISPSSFYWWASFLSSATEIYFPIPLSGWWSHEHPTLDLVVDDEDRYIKIKCREIYKETFSERLYYLRQRGIMKKIKERLFC